MFPSQASLEACGLISEIIEDRKKSKKEPLTLSERIALAQVCAILSVGHEISELTKAANQISHGVSALAKATNMLAHATGELTTINVVITKQ
jgi:hypothetical protein